MAGHGELMLGGAPWPWQRRRLEMWPHLVSSGYDGGRAEQGRAIGVGDLEMER